MTLVEVLAVVVLSVISAVVQGYIGYKLANSNGDNNIIMIARAMAYFAAWSVLVDFFASPYLFVYFLVPFVAGGIARHGAFLVKRNGYAGWLDTRCIHVVSWLVILVAGLTILVQGLVFIFSTLAAMS